MNLGDLYTQTRVSFEAGLEADELTLDGQPVTGAGLQRVSAFLDLVRQMAGLDLHARVDNRNNFPTGAGIASSASAFAALSLAASAVDTEPPLSPGNLYDWDVGDGAREINLFWTESFDNQTPQASIAYEIYMNGVLDHTTSGDRAILYANQAGENIFTVIAVDDAGNRSEPASITIVSQ